MSAVKFLVLIPTYNERENIARALDSLLVQPFDFDLLVIDDSSPDGTASFVRSAYKDYPNVNLVSRRYKEGLGKAYIEGYRWGLSRDYSHFIQMDADGSHRVEDLKILLEASQRNDVVLGARWIKGGIVVNWPLWRKLLSRLGNMYASYLLKLPLADCTGGYRIYSRDFISALDFSLIESNGYSFQIEMASIAVQMDFNILEIPIIFLEREFGSSKMNFEIVLEAIRYVWKNRLRWKYDIS